jgi:tRNA(Ser,Leu) C12 N-acetylase TAN1
LARILRRGSRETDPICSYGSQQSSDDQTNFRKGEEKMSRFEFFQKILTQLNEIQTALNTLRATIKEEIQKNTQTHNPPE